MEEVWPPELAALLDRAPPAELAALGARCPLRAATWRPRPRGGGRGWSGRTLARVAVGVPPLKGVIFADSTGSVMDVAVDMIRVDRG